MLIFCTNEIRKKQIVGSFILCEIRKKQIWHEIASLSSRPEILVKIFFGNQTA